MALRTHISEIEAGDRFRVVRGSRAGSLGVTGSVVIDQLDDSRVSVSVSVGKFGFSFAVQLEVTRAGEDVEIVASGAAFEDIRVLGRVIVNDPTELLVEDVAGELADARLTLADDGTAIVDAEIPSIGRVKLLLAPE